MTDPDFNKHLNEYISSRRKKEGSNRGFFTRKKPLKKVDEEFPGLKDNEVIIVGDRKPFYHWITKKFRVQDTKDVKGSPKKDELRVIEEDVDFASEEHEIAKEIERSPSIWKKISSWFVSEENIPVSIESDDEVSLKENELKSELDEISRREEELKIQLDELEHKKKNITGRFLNLLDEKRVIGADSSKVVSLEDYNRLENDLIDVTKISIEIYKDIPRRKREVFMESEEFRKFKRILKERNIIRENKA